MLGISWTQASGFIQRLLMFLAGVAVANKWIPEDLVIPTIGFLMAIIGWLWGVSDNTQTAIVGKVDTMAKDPTSAVQGVVTTATPEGHALADSLPGSTVAAAGTPAATAIASR